ncbi:hypothetical protein C8Q77DRAFT_901712 [Trametes polyzona]|nr:hypothetical protein C8Q77DRAFT_901712 [Trametes polyzona]
MIHASSCQNVHGGRNGVSRPIHAALVNVSERNSRRAIAPGQFRLLVGEKSFERALRGGSRTHFSLHDSVQLISHAAADTHVLQRATTDSAASQQSATASSGTLARYVGVPPRRVREVDRKVSSVFGLCAYACMRDIRQPRGHWDASSISLQMCSVYATTLRVLTRHADSTSRARGSRRSRPLPPRPSNTDDRHGQVHRAAVAVCTHAAAVRRVRARLEASPVRATTTDSARGRDESAACRGHHSRDGRMRRGVLIVPAVFGYPGMCDLHTCAAGFVNRPHMVRESSGTYCTCCTYIHRASREPAAPDGQCPARTPAHTQSTSI